MATNIKARRALSDLYKQGVEVRFSVDPETGKPTGKIGPFVNTSGEHKPPAPNEISCYVRPPSPLQRDMAMRDGQARRARALINAKRKEDSEEHLTIMAFLADMSDDTLLDYVLINDSQERQQDAMRDVLSREEWKDITDMQDAMRQFDDMPEEERAENEEWVALMEQDQKFGDDVAERLKELADAQRDALRMQSRESLEKRALDKRSEMIGSQAFINEYELQMLFYSVRDPENHSQLFFESAREFAEQHEDFRAVIEEALHPFINEGVEAKN